MGQIGVFIFVPWGGGGRGQVIFFFFFNLSPKSVEAIIDVTDAEFAIPGG